MKLQAASHLAIQLFQEGMRTRHRRIVTIASLVAACYLPTWLGIAIWGISQGKSDFILNLGAIGVGLQILWPQRSSFHSISVGGDDRFLGYALIALGVSTFIFFHSITWSASLQALATMMILSGILWSSWGLEVFQKFPLAIILLLTSLYPDLIFIAIRFFRFFTSEDMLEHIMAWGGSFGLRLLGYAAQSEGAVLSIPSQGSVLVAAGCTGFEMAFNLGGIGFLMGHFMNLNRKKMLILMVAGVVLAWFCNVPRIMLLAIASIYWGKSSFEFWHGPIGGQIFAGILFTIYYYVAMGIIDRKPKVKTN